MTILDDIVCFPNNVVEQFALSLGSIDPSIKVRQRPIRDIDPGSFISVYPGAWNPDEDSIEISGDGIAEPTISRYRITVETLVVDADQVRGNRRSSVLNMLVRHKLFRDPVLLVALPQLRVDLNGSSEVFRRRGIQAQQYMNNGNDATFVYLSVLDVWFETETIRN